MDGLSFTLHFIIIGILSFLLWKQEHQFIFWPALILKLMAGISLGLLYQYYYASGDTWTFFQDGVKVADAISQNPKYFFDYFWSGDFKSLSEPLENDRPRSLFMVKWVALFNLLNGNNYWITSLYFSFISFVSSWMLYRSLIKLFPGFKPEAAISILFIPSIVFWGSGIIKESLALAALFGITASFVSWYDNRSVKLISLVAGLFSFWILWNLKYYWLAVWLAVIAPVVLVQLLRVKVDWIKHYPKLSWVLFLFFALAVVSVIHPNFYYDRLLLVIVENHNAYLKLSNPEDVIHFNNLEPSVIRIVVNSPWALLSGVFRPFIFEAGNFVQAGAGLENLILLLLSILSFKKILKHFATMNELHLALSAYIILLGAFLALSTPNFGSLSRYKIGFTPFLWFLLLSASGVLKGYFLQKSRSIHKNLTIIF